MFTTLVHGLIATLVRIRQLWTKENIPSGVFTEHDFNDGDGPVPAVPYDQSALQSDMAAFSSMQNVDSCAVCTRIVGKADMNNLDTSAISCNIVSFSEE